MAVVDDLDERDAAAGDTDPDACRSGVDGVLDQLFDNRDRSLDDLTGRDLANRSFIQQPKRHPASVSTSGSKLGARPSVARRDGGSDRERYTPSVGGDMGIPCLPESPLMF